MSAIVKAVFLIAFIGAFVFTVKAVYHMYFVVTNITGKHGNFLGPFVLLMPSQFNAEGNKHRAALAPALFGVIVCWGALEFARSYLGL